MHEGYENGKIYLPGPCLLHFLNCFWRQPVSRGSPRGVVSLEDQRMCYAEVPGSMTLLLCSRTRPGECDFFRMAETAFAGQA